MEIKITIAIEAPELAQAINNLAAALSGTKLPVPSVTTEHEQKLPEPAPVNQPAVPVAPPPQYTQEQIMQAGAQLLDAGRADELVALLKKFNVRAVMDLKPEQLGAFATALREMGAKI